MTDNSAEAGNVGLSRVTLFGFDFHKVTLNQAVEHVLDLVEGETRGHYVVTPNVDHVVLISKKSELASVFNSASLVLVDGMPIIWASRWLNKGLPERVAGSDLVPGVFRAARSPLKVFMLGARPGVAQIAAKNIELKYRNVQVVGIHSPPLGFESNEAANEEAIRKVAAAAPDVLVLGLGTPKQEIWAHRVRRQLDAKVILCAGATIDFMAGEQKRAPLWCQQYGMEWAYRALNNPRRLLPRYATDALVFPRLLVKEFYGKRA